jgi:hypothetical protein
VIDQILLYGNQQMKKIIIIISLMAASLTGAQAALIITEVMSSSGTGGTPDWFEVTNTGASAVDITNFRFDDGSFNFNASVSLVGVTSIAAGQSVVFIETNTPLTTIPDFRTFWGGSATTAVIGSYSGTGVGLSSGSDGVRIYDTSENSVASVLFGAATTGKSFGYDLASYPNQNGFTGSGFDGLSVNGSNGAFISANALGNIGSPGVAIFPSEVPEPSRLGFLGLSFIILLFTRSRR